MIATARRSQRADISRPEVAPHEEQTVVESFETELGWMAIAWWQDALGGIVFGHASRRNVEIVLARSLRMLHPHGRFAGLGQSSDTPHWVKELADSLQRYANGESVDFFDVPLALDHLTPFARSVVAACRRIRWGQTKAYGDLANECGAPGAARAVGSVMAKNRYPLVVPCHRVLAAGGALGGYSAPDGLRMKRRLLSMERART